MNALFQASARIEAFRAGSLRRTVADMEQAFRGAEKSRIPALLQQSGITLDLVLAALLIKRHSRQINEIIHAVGLLTALPCILEKGESVESLSLAAGNTGNALSDTTKWAKIPISLFYRIATAPTSVLNFITILDRKSVV